MSDTSDDPLDNIPDATPAAQARIQALAAQARDLRQQLAAVAPKLAEVTTITAERDALRATHEAAIAEWTAKETTWQTERAILGAGITDPEAADFVAHAYGKVTPDAEGKKPALGEWLQNREALPRGVRAYLPEAAATAQTAASTATGAAAIATAAKAQPRVNAGATQAAPVNAPFTAAQIAAMTPAEYAKNRAAIMASLPRG